MCHLSLVTGCLHSHILCTTFRQVPGDPPRLVEWESRLVHIEHT